MANSKLCRVLDAMLNEEVHGRPVFELIASALVEKALGGEVMAIRTIIEMLAQFDPIAASAQDNEM